MNVLAELHQENDLKLNLKFEIEVLCKTLNIDIATELKPTKYLRDPTRMQTLEHQLSPVKPQEEPVPSAATPNPPLPIPLIPGMAISHHIPPPPPTSTITIPPPPSVGPPVTSAPSVAPMYMQAKFSIHDINTASLASFLQQHIVINEQASGSNHFICVPHCSNQ